MIPTHTIDSLVKPESHSVIDVLPNTGILPIQIRLFHGKVMQVVSTSFTAPLPCTALFIKVTPSVQEMRDCRFFFCLRISLKHTHTYTHTQLTHSLTHTHTHQRTHTHSLFSQTYIHTHAHTHTHTHTHTHRQQMIKRLPMRWNRNFLLLLGLILREPMVEIPVRPVRS